MAVAIVPHNESWKQSFTDEAEDIWQAIGRNVTAVHHIGSTSIPGILAKPVIDILVEVADIAQVDAREQAMRDLGYEARGEYGISGRRYFRKSDSEGRSTYHVHVFAAGSERAREHIVFRDFLLAHPEIAREYSALKAKLTSEDSITREEYQKGKDPFIEEVLADAVMWSGAQ